MEVNRTILHRTIRRMLAITAGIILIAVGIAGLILPLLPGWPFIAAGIILLWPKTRMATWLKHLPARIREWFRKRRGLPGEDRPTDRYARFPHNQRIDENVEHRAHNKTRSA